MGQDWRAEISQTKSVPGKDQEEGEKETTLMAGIVEDFKIEHDIKLSIETMIFVVAVIVFCSITRKKK